VAPAVGARAWDVGCGTGATVAYLAQLGLCASGLDLSRARLAEAREQHPASDFIRGSADTLPCASESLDGVVAECTWSVCAPAGDALAEWGRVLKPGGWLVMSDVYAREPAAPVPDLAATSCWRRLPGEAEISAALDGTGFDIQLWEDHAPALKAYAAQLIWNHGSLAPLLGEGADQPETRSALNATRPSYFLLVARKR
jgi:ubiquinone/menaquinone biosynthesis C-methylase UbiE